MDCWEPVLGGGGELLEGLELDAAPGSFPGGGGGLFEPASLEGCDLPDLLLGAGEPAGWLEGDSGASTLEHGSAGGGASSGGGHDATPSSSHGWPAPALSPCVQQRSDTAVVPDAADSNRGAAGGVQPEQLSDAELKRQARLARNRTNAQLSRQRKKAAVQGLESRAAQLEAANAQLAGMVSRLTAEVAALRYHLITACQAARRPVPHVPSALGPPAAGPVGAAGAGAPPPGLPLPLAPLPPAVALQVAAGRLPLVPGAAPFAPKPAGAAAPAGALPAAAQQPAAGPPLNAAPPAQRQPQPAQQQQAAVAATAAAAAATNARKRARTAGVPLLALFTLLMFVGPFAPSGGSFWQAAPAGGAAPVGPAAAQAALPAASGSLAVEHPRSGRGLLQAIAPADTGLPALPGGSGSDGSSKSVPLVRSTSTALAAFEDVRSAGIPAGSSSSSSSGGGSMDEAAAAGAAEGSSKGQLAALWNTTLGALWPTRQPMTGPQLEALALQRLQELAPVALLLDGDDPTALSPHPLAASEAFPQLAGQLFGSSGLLPPQTCRPVFELDASTLPAAERSRRSIERLLLGSLGMRGRARGLLGPAASAAAGHGRGEAAALPSGGGSRLGQEAEEEVAAHEWVEEDGVWRQVPNSGSSRSGSGGGSMGGEGGAEPALRLVAPRDAPSASASVLVSILVPAANTSVGKGEGEGEGEGASPGLLSALGKVFVVLLHPRQRYVTYACSLW